MDEDNFVSGKSRYMLSTAILIVRQVETQATRNAVFSEIKAKNFVYNLADKLYYLAGYFFLQPVVLFFYMLKCISSVPVFNDTEVKLIGIENYDNESHSIKRVLSIIPDINAKSLKLDRCNAFTSGQGGAYWNIVKTLPRYWRFISRLSKSYDFMPACRIASVLAYYIHFRRMFGQNPGLSAALVASNYSPDALGMAAAAHMSNRNVIYANHAPVPHNSKFVPPDLADCSPFYGDAVRKTYQSQSRIESEVILIGQPIKSIPLRWSKKISTVGIFLTALTHWEPLKDLIEKVKAHNPNVEILIRHHPVSLLETDISSLLENHSGVRATRGTPLKDDIEDCDLVFCGNSGVAMNVLCGGCPVAYLPCLDRLPYDYLGFVASNLVCEVKGWDISVYEQIRKFYDNKNWQSRMRENDAAYLMDDNRLLKIAREKLNNWTG